MAEPGAGERLKVFISYSRRDAAEFADELSGVLDLAGFAPFLDRQDIAAGEDWEARLTGLIAEADTVVFVVSPEAIKSVRCMWEVEATMALPKRLLPVVYKTVAKADIPQMLRRLQFIHFDKAPGVAKPLGELAAALRQDLGWIREHTRLGELAARWERRGRPDSLLLRGDELDAVKEWAERRNLTAPEITDAQLALLAASDEAENARLSKERAQLDEMARAQASTARFQVRAARLLWTVAVLVFALLGYVTWQSYDVARREMLIYTGLAAIALNDGQVDRAMRYALQGYPARGSLPWLTPFSSELEGKLAGGAHALALQRLLVGHSANVVGVAFSPDGTRVATASDDHTARLWRLAPPAGPGGAAHSAADASADEMVAVLEGHTDAVRSVTFDPGGKRVLTASDDKTARLWDAQTGRPLVVLKGHTGAVLSAAFDPAGKRVVTASNDHTARIWDAASGEELAVLDGHTQWVWSAAFDPAGKRVVTASNDSTARLWDADSGKTLAVFNGHTGGVLDASFDRDGSRVLTASLDGTARIWDTGTGTALAVLSGHTDAVWSAAFDPAGRWVVTGSHDQTARIWEADGGKEVVVLRGHTEAVRRVAFSPDGKLVVTASDDATARVWDAGSRTASADGSVSVWDADSRKQIAALKGHTGRVLAVAFDRASERVATGSSDHSARVWVAETNKEAAILAGHTDGVASAAYDGAGKRIVTASSDKTARVWGVASGKEIAVLTGHTGALESAAFDREGKRVVTASDDKTARIWDASGGSEIAVLTGHTATVQSAAFDREGRRIVTASDDATARIWDAASRQADRGPQRPHRRGAERGVRSLRPAHRHRLRRWHRPRLGRRRRQGDRRAQGPHRRRAERGVRRRGQARGDGVAGQDRAHLGARHRPGDRDPHRPCRRGAQRRVRPRRQARGDGVLRRHRAHLGRGGRTSHRRPEGPPARALDRAVEPRRHAHGDGVVRSDCQHLGRVLGGRGARRGVARARLRREADRPGAGIQRGRAQ